MPGDDAAELFATHRPLMFTVAYEILGTATDADDVLQEAYLKWSGVDASTVSHPRAYLVRTVASLALNHLRTVARRREEYIGNWVPEPVQTVPDVADDVLLAGSVSMAMLLVLETLAPVERAVFVLREVFGCEFAEIAAQRPRYFDYLVTRSIPPSRHEGGRVSFTPVDGGTRVDWSTKVRVPLVPDFLVQHVALPIFAHVFRRVLLTCERDLASTV